MVLGARLAGNAAGDCKNPRTKGEKRSHQSQFIASHRGTAGKEKRTREAIARQGGDSRMFGVGDVRALSLAV